ncbi:MAG: cyclic nucleotide-binding domain-containing protein [Anaerolineales bacterium]
MISKELLKWYPLFAGMSPYLAKEIAMISNEIEVKEGEWLFYEEAPSDKFYIVIEGSISLTTNIYLDGKVHDIEAVDPIGPGEIVGWSALVEPHQYTLGGRARESCRLIEIDVVPFRNLLEDNPEFGYETMKHVSKIIRERMNNTCIQLLSLVLDFKRNSIEKTLTQ